MKSKNLILFFIFITVFSIRAQKQDLYQTLRNSLNIFNYIGNSAWNKMPEQAIAELASVLRKSGYDLNINNNDSIRAGRFFIKRTSQDICYYTTQKGDFWISLHLAPVGVTPREAGLRFSNNKIWFHSSVGQYNRLIYLTARTENLTAIGALYQVKNFIINIGFNIPFTIKDIYDNMPQKQKEYVNKKSVELFKVVEQFSKNIIAPDVYSDMFYNPAKSKSLSSEERLFGLIKFWSEAKYNFAFFDKVPELNWDKELFTFIPIIQRNQTNAEYFKNLKKFCALLKDGHTNIYPPQLPDNSDSPMIELFNIKKEAIVKNVSTSLKDKIEIGSKILKINGVPTENYLKKNVFPYISSSTEHILYDWGIRDMLKGKHNSKLKLMLQKPNGTVFEIKLICNQSTSKDNWVNEVKNKSELLEFRMIDNNFAYIAINSFNSPAVVTEFKKHFDQIKLAGGLIVDIRNNGGGNSGNGWEIIKLLTDKPFLTSKWKTREHNAANKAWAYSYTQKTVEELNKLSGEEKTNAQMLLDYYNGNHWYEASPDTIIPPKGEKIGFPVVVLTGHNTASAAEDFLVSLDYLKRATFIGQYTFGSTGQPLQLVLPGGATARICTKRDTYPDGREFVGYGIKPDIPVEPTLDDFLNKRDPVLQTALDYLKSKVKK